MQRSPNSVYTRSAFHCQKTLTVHMMKLLFYLIGTSVDIILLRIFVLFTLVVNKNTVKKKKKKLMKNKSTHFSPTYKKRKNTNSLQPFGCNWPLVYKNCQGCIAFLYITYRYEIAIKMTMKQLHSCKKLIWTFSGNELSFSISLANIGLLGAENH